LSFCASKTWDVNIKNAINKIDGFIIILLKETEISTILNNAPIIFDKPWIFTGE